ncbi:MAG TPA: 4Fe-4S dicluster domain-containing protein [Bacteroidales bacterium]|nr:4Fe-4S dicluster domain-containing protein [Bacteroidales bacterium]
MVNFGFTLLKGRQIDYDKNDRSLAEYILLQEPSFSICFECGGCSATCTAGNFTPFSLRRLNILIKRGENEEVGREISKCMLCGKCTLVCPRGVNTRNVITLTKKAFQKNIGNADTI